MKTQADVAPALAGAVLKLKSHLDNDGDYSISLSNGEPTGIGDALIIGKALEAIGTALSAPLDRAAIWRVIEEETGITAIPEFLGSLADHLEGWTFAAAKLRRLARWGEEGE